MYAEKTNLHGSAGWAAGFSDEESVKPHVVPAETAATAASSSEGWSVMQRAFFFAAIVAIIAVFVRSTRGGKTPADQGYQKSMV